MKLSNERYEQIKRYIADFFEDYGIKEIPIDVFSVARKMNIKIVFASEMLKKHPEKINPYFLYQYPPAFMYYDTKTQKFIVYIDDIGTTLERQRYSLSHELMHVILGHFEQNPQNEAEANFGATYMLAPTSLTLVNPTEESLRTPKAIARIFQVSNTEAWIIARYNTKRILLQNLRERDYEKKINCLLKESLYEKLREFR